jgi:hypothetical protein
MGQFREVPQGELLFANIHVVFDRLEVVVKGSWVLIASLPSTMVFFGDIGFGETTAPDELESPIFEIPPGGLCSREMGSLVVSPLCSMLSFHTEESCGDLVLIDSVSLRARFKEVVELVNPLGALL